MLDCRARFGRHHERYRLVHDLRESQGLPLGDKNDFRCRFGLGDQGRRHLFTEKIRLEGGAIKDFLCSGGSDRSRAVEFNRAPYPIEDQVSPYVSSVREWECGEKA
jgi:hypothetical protein